MATKQTKSLAFCVLFLLMSSFSSSAQARPLGTFNNEAKEVLEGFIDGFPILGVKNAGPSPGGKGHEFSTVDVDALGGIKNSGPSPGGKGHAFATVAVLGGIKNSGPSPGRGHAQVISANHQ